MAESSLWSGSSEPEIPSLREALRAHQKLLQKLQVELEEEREASATAASEALSVILRIQGEKAAVKMEANQYKRIAEEKMCHLEESTAIFEDLICQKQLEIATLDFQVQSYRCRLLSFGFSDLGVNDKLRIGKTLLPFQQKDSYLKNNSLEIENFLLPIPDFVPNLVEEAADLEDYDHIYCLAKKSCEGQKQLDYGFDKVKVYENQDSSSLSKIQDIYEIPLSKKAPLANKACESNYQSKSIAEVERRLEKPDTDSDEICLTNFRVKGKKRRKKKLLLPRKHENIKLRSKESNIAKGYVAPILVKSSDGEAQLEIEQSCNRNEHLEVENCGRRQEISEKELNMLREIHEKLDFIQSEMTNRRPKKYSLQLESTLLILSEAMLYFWV